MCLETNFREQKVFLKTINKQRLIASQRKMYSSYHGQLQELTAGKKQNFKYLTNMTKQNSHFLSVERTTFPRLISQVGL